MCVLTEKDLEGKSEEEKEMMKLMGFGNFESTKVSSSFLLSTYKMGIEKSML